VGVRDGYYRRPETGGGAVTAGPSRRAYHYPWLMPGFAPTETRSGPTADAFEARIREQERHTLSDLAVRSYETRGRAREEPPCRLRTPFQRDRDRIVHTKAFRRLMHKTQVFIAPEGDHYRTRLTHTLETTGISRGVARALRLNEDLVEAIGLGHDLGHPPFGHAGEEALDAALHERFGLHFRHNEHSLRVVDVLERDGRGLNLTEEVRDGILNHTGEADPFTLEGRIVKLVDRVAYINHDIDDAVRAGVLKRDELPRDEIELLGSTGAKRIDTLVHDIVEASAPAGEIRQSPEIGEAMLSLRRFMFDRVYLGPQARSDNTRAGSVVRRIFDHLIGLGDEVEETVDYVAGMTDRFAFAFAAEL
jgi:dGTPase